MSDVLFQRLAWRVSKLMARSEKGRALLITSAGEGEGKSFIASALADALNKHALGRVALIECVRLEVPTSAVDRRALNLSELVDAGLTPAQRSAFANGSVNRIPFGTGNPNLIYRRDALCRALDLLRDHFGFVILDGPPMADCGALTECADAHLLVINAKRMRREMVQASLDSPVFDKSKLLGAVLNERDRQVPRWLQRRGL